MSYVLGFVSPEAKRSLLEEIEQMQQLGPHPNVVCFLGYSLEEPISLVMEYCPNGDLRSFLVGLRQVSLVYYGILKALNMLIAILQFWQLKKVSSGSDCSRANRPDSDSGISQVLSPNLSETALRDRAALDKGAADGSLSSSSLLHLSFFYRIDLCL